MIRVSIFASCLVVLALAHVYKYDPDVSVVMKYDMQGVQVEVLKRGECDKKCDPGDMLTAEFHGFLAETKERFESSEDHQKPSSFKLGHGYMIKGLEIGLQKMCVGEIRRLHIPAPLAYGKIGDGKNVHPGADLIYDVEIINIQKGKRPPNIFAKIDLNHDKMISRDEMENFILGTGRAVTLRGQSEINSVLDEIFKLEDLNHDGVIEMHEFSGPKASKHDEL